MAWTTPWTAATGNVVTETQLNETRNNLRFLKGLDGEVTIDDRMNWGSGAIGGTVLTDAVRVRLNASGGNFFQAGGSSGSAFFGFDAANSLGILGTLGGTHPLVFRVNNTERARLNDTGLGVGTNDPKTRLHALQNQGGFIFWAASGIGASSVTVVSGLPASSITRRVVAIGNIYHSSGTVAGSGAFSVAVATTAIASDGSNTLSMTVTSTSITLARTAGSGTYDVALLLTYQ